MALYSFYRLARSKRGQEVPHVERVVTRRDGTLQFEKMAKVVAPDLETFRREYPGTPVQGEIKERDIGAAVSTLSEDDLRKLGLQRTTAVEGEPEPIFASEQAAELAKSLNQALFVPGEGTGRNGRYNTADVRGIIDSLK